MCAGRWDWATTVRTRRRSCSSALGRDTEKGWSECQVEMRDVDKGLAGGRGAGIAGHRRRRRETDESVFLIPEGQGHAVPEGLHLE